MIKFIYGVMGSGKSEEIIRIANNYKQTELNILIMKPSIDTRDSIDEIVSRNGLKIKVDILISETTNLLEFDYSQYSCIIIDEINFLTITQIDQLHEISILLNIEIICVGLKTDYTTTLFPSSKRLIEIADEVTELSMLCQCGAKAKFNLKLDEKGNVVINSNKRIDIGIHYISVCSKCYYNNKVTEIFEFEKTKTVPNGLSKVSGIVKKIDTFHLYYEFYTKMEVILDNGTLVYGTVPISLLKNKKFGKGCHVSFTATFYVSKYNNKIGIYKYPTLGEVL